MSLDFRGLHTPAIPPSHPVFRDILETQQHLVVSTGPVAAAAYLRVWLEHWQCRMLRVVANEDRAVRTLQVMRLSEAEVRQAIHWMKGRINDLTLAVA